MRSTMDLDSTYGAMYIGIMVATFFQGILTLQSYVYYETYRKDSWKLKALVAVVWSIDFIHLIFIGKAGYHYFITNWGNVDSLAMSVWEFDAHPILIGVATILSQAFFLWRLYRFSGQNVFLLLFLTAICLVPFVFNVYIAVQSIKVNYLTPAGLADQWGKHEIQSLRPEAINLFVWGATSDVLIASILCYYLHQEKSDYEKTNSLIDRVIRYTVTTGLATSVFAVACLVTYFIRPESFIFVSMHFSLGRMYTNNLIAALNYRHQLRGINNRCNACLESVSIQFTSTTNGTSNILNTEKDGTLPFFL
ncbi:hypothetical protein M422DRAFT_781718 [Sphaerobolus stellatus SS14]|uniref:DUF6534 domain-containing protein n=1 Tax=Sphaerobolus stellatus (strain SS14) TaxID=990650 RepID=A0A0C9U3D8_SPHS4|nr:hypothetical protein M422DRAFT_781718 [Sphaerobolus stellatus SS14]